MPRTAHTGHDSGRDPLRAGARRRRVALGATALRGGRTWLTRRPTPYVVVGGLFWLVMTLAYWRVPLCCDAGQHAAVVERLRWDLLHPAHPTADLPGAGSPYYSPYAVTQGVLARLTGLSGWSLVKLAGPVNLLVLLTGIGRLVRVLTPRPWAPVLALLFMTLLWGTERILWSGYLGLMSMTTNLGYPSACATGLTFWAWAWTAARARGGGFSRGVRYVGPRALLMDLRGRRSGVRCVLSACRAKALVAEPLGLLSGAARVRAGRRDAAEIHQKGPSGLGSLWAYTGLGTLYGLILLVHPITAVASMAGAVAIVAAWQRGWRGPLVGRWALTGAIALAVAVSWPYYDILSLAGNTGVDGMHKPLYENVAGHLWLALFGLPALWARGRRSPRDPLVLMFAAECLVVAYGWVSGHYTYGRVLGLAAVPAQFALAVELAAPRPWGWARHVLGGAAVAGACVGFLTVQAGAVVPSRLDPVGFDPPPRWPSYAWVARHVRAGDVLITDGYFAERAVAGYGVNLAVPTWPDPALDERERARRYADVRAYLDPASSRAKRAVVARRYGVRWVLLARWQRVPGEAVVVGWSAETGEVLARIAP
ncbi:hypothetical protein JIX56_28565 [Streptomyces sp. CA-210063]|uniref:hypothetical protein n=1 Tax=Streptomyces sp. CA-210063 TaxID=2801029 RepID=UPI00214CC9DE|nr:hypothetical protein [Streptomyces sp. CA-210063]UUU33486.1 hypothetical protein JIX56_28565 [Streptomyces sp. CA-210063]